MEDLIKKIMTETEVFSDDDELTCRAFVSVHTSRLKRDLDKSTRAAIWRPIAGIAIRQAQKLERA